VILDHLPALETALTRKGFPPMSPWWRSTVEAFYRSTRRQLVLRVGRRGGKSSTLCRIAVLEALYGEHQIPPGDAGVVGFVSVRADEASQRLRTIRAILDALRVRHKPIDGGLELVDRPIVFKVFPATLGAVVGGTWIFAACDEVARWRDTDSGVNPASEVLASLRPTMATQRNARIFVSSSPLGRLDAHAKAFDEGDTARQMVAYAPTWVANPTLTEEDTRREEPDPRIWSREYLAVPQSGALEAFDPDAVARAFERRVEPAILGQTVLIIDASSGRKDTWSWAVARWVQPKGGIADVLRVELVDGVEGSFWKTLTGEQIVDRLAIVCKEWGIRRVFGDQREDLMLRSAFTARGLDFTSLPWTASTKPPAVERVRKWFSEGTIQLPEHDALRRELLTFEERIAPSGQFTFGARGSGHDDYVALLITAAMADTVGGIAPASQATLGVPAPIVSDFDRAPSGFDGVDEVAPIIAAPANVSPFDPRRFSNPQQQGAAIENAILGADAWRRPE
jgi:hypothetical protein